MSLENTYTNQIKQNIKNKEKYIQHLKETISSLMDQNGSTELKNLYHELLNEIDIFEQFKAEQEMKIDRYFKKGIKQIISSVKDDRVFQTRLSPAIPELTDDKTYKSITRGYYNFFQEYLKKDFLTDEKKDFIGELYKYSGTPLSCVYTKSNFSNFNNNLKVQLTQDLINIIAEQTKNLTPQNLDRLRIYELEVFNQILNDEVVKEYICSEEAKEYKDKLYNIAEKIENARVISNDVLEDILARENRIFDGVASKIKELKFEEPEKDNTEINQERY